MGFGCGNASDDRPENNASRDQAVYFEDGAANDTDAWAQRGLRVTPEYHSVGTLLVSLRLLTEPETKESIAKAILDAGADLIVVTDKEFAKGLDNLAFDKLR